MAKAEAGAEEGEDAAALRRLREPAVGPQPRGDGAPEAAAVGAPKAAAVGAPEAAAAGEAIGRYKNDLGVVCCAQVCH